VTHSVPTESNIGTQTLKDDYFWVTFDQQAAFYEQKWT